MINRSFGKLETKGTTFSGYQQAQYCNYPIVVKGIG